MSVRVRERRDITLELVHAVAWRGARLEIAPEALRLMDRCHERFEAYVADRVRAEPGALIYGVTSAPGDAAASALSQDARAERPSQLWTAMSFGEPLPTRVVRAIVVARLANMVEGHAAVRSEVAEAVAGLLDGDRLPTVPVEGNGGSGEILALGSLFFELSTRLELTAKERMALINGSPCAAALVADVALAGRRRIELAESTLALVADAAGAPDEHYAAELEQLWGDDHETAALRSLRELLDGSTRERQSHQASVSLRILPRILGAARRAQAEAERAASVSLQLGDRQSGLSPAQAAAAGGGGLLDRRLSQRPGYARHGWARLRPRRPLPAGAALDRPSLSAAAHRVVHRPRRMDDQAAAHGAERMGRERPRARASHAAVARRLWPKRRSRDELSVLAESDRDRPLSRRSPRRPGCRRLPDTARQAREPPAALRSFVDQIRSVFPPVTKPRPLGQDAEKLTQLFSRHVFG